MKQNHGVFNSAVLAILLGLCVLLFAREGFAEDSERDWNDGKVEVVYPAQSSLAYRERRGNWSGVLGINIEQIFPDKFRSKITDDSYENLFGKSPVAIAQLEVGAQGNFGFGSLGASVLYGYGGIKDSRSGGDRVLNLTKESVSLQYTINTLFSEPYVAPYLKTEFTRFSWKETGFGFKDQSGTTDFSTALTVGLLIQLNALDPQATLEARNNSGLSNTFLDLYLSQYNTSSSETDPNFESTMNVGFGLKLEF